MSRGDYYLTYVPWPGQLNNTRICFETTLVLAYISGRTLVLPDAYRWRGEAEWRDDQYRPLHPADFLDLDDVQRLVPMISQQDYAAGTQDGWRHGVSDVSIEPGTTVFCYPRAPGDGEARDLAEFAAGRNTLLWLTPELNDCRTLNLDSPTLEPFYAFYYFSRPDDWVACRDLVRHYIRFRPQIQAAGEWIAGLLGDFAAVHVRRGDFLSQRPDQDLTVERIATSLARAGARSGRLYIASDEADRGFFEWLRPHYEIFFVDQFREGPLYEMPDEHIACVEQVVCSHADVFIGTRLSTFSSYITRLRGYGGARDQGIHFTDGEAGSEGDDGGSPGYSWVNWLRQGQPLWGREYREGWRY